MQKKEKKKKESAPMKNVNLGTLNRVRRQNKICACACSRNLVGNITSHEIIHGDGLNFQGGGQIEN